MNIDNKQRDLILEVKNKILTTSGRTPLFSGYTIYKYIVDYKMQSFTEIIQFLHRKGII